MANTLRDNKSVKILQAASEGGYGVAGVVSYNLETIVAVVRAAEKKRSPCQILLFPWAMHYAGGLLVNLAIDACKNATVPITVHIDHAQNEEDIMRAAEFPLESIMIDFSHFEKDENLERTRKLVKYCHSKGIATEAEPGRIEGGEDGVSDTTDLLGLLTTAEEASEFMDTGIDFLAPAFGNVHGFYGGVHNIKLDLERLDSIHNVAKGRSLLVLHGTNEFEEQHFRSCVERGVTRTNVNDVVLKDYQRYRENGKVPLTEMMENGTKLIQQRLEALMDWLGSTGKAP